MLRQSVPARPSLTVADVCQAIEAGRLTATVDSEQHYRIDRDDLLRYAHQTLLSLQVQTTGLN